MDMMLHLLACLFVDELYECFFVGGEDLGLLCCAICLLTLRVCLPDERNAYKPKCCQNGGPVPQSV